MINSTIYFSLVGFFFVFRVEIYFSNLFNGDKLLGDTTNRFLNENWEDIYKEIKPAFVEAIGKVVETVINNVFTKIPYKDAFLEE